MRAQCSPALKSSSSNTILKDFKTMDREIFQQQHGVVINEDNTVCDVLYQKTFKNIHEWIKYSEAQEEGEVGGFQRGNERYAFDDD